MDRTLKEANRYGSNNYKFTDDSWTKFIDARGQASYIMWMDNPSQDLVNKGYSDLRNAINNLREK